MLGMERQRVAEIICQAPSRFVRGSGYQLAPGIVLTAAHVVVGAVTIRARFNADQADEQTYAVNVAVADQPADVAVLTYVTGGQTDGRQTDGGAPPLFGVVGRADAVIPFAAVGFPRFKLRRDAPPAGGPGPGSWYRDSHHAHGTIAALSNLRQARLELEVAPPDRDPDPSHSPWEGMSGAAVWTGGLIVGLVSEHHRREGPNRLTATSVEAWYRMPFKQLERLRELTGLPADERSLPDVTSEPTAPGADSAGPTIIVRDSVVFDRAHITAGTFIARDSYRSDERP